MGGLSSKNNHIDDANNCVDNGGVAWYNTRYSGQGMRWYHTREKWYSEATVDKIAEAIVKVVEAGAPLANQAIVLYYVSDILASVLTAVTVLGVVGLVTYTIRYGIRLNLNLDGSKRRF